MMPCNNKGCCKTQCPEIDTKTNEVYCSECGNIIQGVSHFTKTQMKTLGQTRKPKKTAYSVRCEKCRLEALPKIENNVLVCSACNNPHKNVSAPFAILIRKAIVEGNKDI